MPVIDPDSIFKKLASDRARMETLGVTEHEMVKFYNRCGSEGQHFDEAIAELNARFQFNADDAAFVATSWRKNEFLLTTPIWEFGRRTPKCPAGIPPGS